MILINLTKECKPKLKVLLVGGTSRIPLLSDLLVSEVGFSEHKINKSVNEDEVVAAGAAVYAAKIAGTLEVSYLIEFLK